MSKTRLYTHNECPFPVLHKDGHAGEIDGSVVIFHVVTVKGGLNASISTPPSNVKQQWCKPVWQDGGWDEKYQSKIVAWEVCMGYWDTSPNLDEIYNYFHTF